MAEIRINAEIFLSPAYGKLDSDERALFWELYALSPSKGRVSIEQAEFSLHRRAGSAAHRTIRQSLAILSRAGLVRVDEDFVEMACPHVRLSNEAERKAKSRANLKTKGVTAAPSAPKVAVELAPVLTVADPAVIAEPVKKAKKEKALKPAPEPISYTLPEYVDKALFEEYLDAYSKRTRQAVNQRKVDALIRQLVKFNEGGFDISQTIEDAIIGGENGTYLKFYPAEKAVAASPNSQVTAPEELRTELPDFIPAELFHEYLAKRAAAAGKPNTQVNIDFLINQLHDFNRKNVNIRGAIERAMKGGPNGTYQQFIEEKPAAFHGTKAGNVNPNSARGRWVG